MSFTAMGIKSAMLRKSLMAGPQRSIATKCNPLQSWQTHWRRKGQRPLRKRSSDCFNLSPGDKLVNAQNYAFLAAVRPPLVILNFALSHVTDSPCTTGSLRQKQGMQLH